MPRPFPIISQSDYLIQIVDKKCTYWMSNSADPDQLTSSEANWSGSTCLQRQGISGFSRTRVKVNCLNCYIWFLSTLKTICPYFLPSAICPPFLLQNCSFHSECYRYIAWFNKLPNVMIWWNKGSWDKTLKKQADCLCYCQRPLTETRLSGPEK